MAASTELTPEQLPGFLNSLTVEAANLDYGPVMRSLAILVKSDLKSRFVESNSPDGVAWRPLKYPRIRSKGVDHPLRDRGIMMASVSSNGPGHIERIDSLSLEVGSNLQQAALMNFGGVVRPRKGKALSIPLTPEAYRAGGARRFPRPLFVVQRIGGTPMLAESKMKGRGKKRAPTFIFHYALVRQVKIPARPFAGISAKGVGLVQEKLGDYVASKLGTA